MEPYDALFYHTPDKVVPDINMLGAVVEQEILWNSNPTLVVFIDHGGIQHMPKKITKELPQPYRFKKIHTLANMPSTKKGSKNIHGEMIDVNVG